MGQPIEPIDQTPIDIIYKYRKDKQINGTLFYAFEYLIKLIEEAITPVPPALALTAKELRTTKKDTLPKLFIVCPTKMKKILKEKYFCIFIKKYPITKIGSLSYYTNSSYNKEISTLTEEEKPAFYDAKKLVTKAFTQITFITPLEFLRLSPRKLVFASYNSFTELPERPYADAGSEPYPIVFQNRANHQIEPPTRKAIYLYETPHQFQKELQPIGPHQTQHQYNLKLGFKYFYPKKFFSTKYNRQTKMHAGIIPVNLYDSPELFKPTKFIDTSVFNNLYFFDSIKSIRYYRNFKTYEENNRIIPEARYYDFKIEILDTTPEADGTFPDYDTSVTRLKEPLDNYDLASENTTDIFNSFYNTPIVPNAKNTPIKDTK